MSRLLPLVVLLTVGCGGSDHRPVFPARGSVFAADGQPADGAMVVFHPRGDPAGERHKPVGVAGPDGTFALATYVSGDGAPAGEYAVTVEWRPECGPGEPPLPDRLGGRFRDPATSGLTATVEPKDNDLPPIRLP